MRTETCSIEPKFDDRSPLIRVGAAAVVLDRVADATRDEFMTKSFEGSSIDGAVVLSCTVNVAGCGSSCDTRYPRNFNDLDEQAWRLGHRVG